MTNAENNKNRLNFLDEARGLAVLCMIFYHAFYICGYFFEWDEAAKLFDFFMPVQPFFAGIFIFICGISCTLSESNLKRGLILLGVAAGFTLVTALLLPALGFVGTEIYFGILHLLAVSVLIYALFEKKLESFSPFTGILLCAVLYAFTSGIGEGELGYGSLIKFTLPESLYEHDFLMPIGIYSPSFYSADYFPIFPHIFIFLSGAFAGRYYLYKGYPEWCYQKRIPFFSFLGKKSLIIYVVHMPVIFAVAYAIKFIINMF
ncbi:MAG: DUF1624 domain-containing protein [Clostridia bacterium]|nr:DUF1624 domain-containing protein [Clostridia bacterium]